MRTIAIRDLSKSYVLSKEQQEIIVGLILGDGHLETQNSGRTYKLKVEHSLKQREYVEWLYSKFSSVTLTKPRLKEQRIREKMYQKYLFSTIALDAFRFYGKLFYPLGKKIVPKVITQLVSPLSLAVWFMDDGSIKSKVHRAKIINTQGFSPGDLVHLQDMLHDKFDIHTTLRNQKEGKQVYIPSTDIANLPRSLLPLLFLQWNIS